MIKQEPPFRHPVIARKVEWHEVWEAYRSGLVWLPILLLSSYMQQRLDAEANDGG